MGMRLVQRFHSQRCKPNGKSFYDGMEIIPFRMGKKGDLSNLERGMVVGV